MNHTEATQYIKATLAAFGPGEAINMTLDTWTKLHEAMSVLVERPEQQEPVAWIEHDDETAEPCPSCGKPLQSASGGGVVCSERCGYWFCF